MNVLVTGGAGFIGSNFLNAAVPRHPEWRFVNLDCLTYAANLGSLAPIHAAANYRLVQADIADAQAIERVFAEFDPELVVHFAAETHVDRSIVAPDAFIRTNVQGTFTLLEACRRRWAGRPQALFHHVSTDEVYGSLGASGAFHEESRYNPSSPYSASKAASDHLVRAYHRTYGTPVKITNCSNNYGPGQFPEKLVPLMIVQALEGKPLPVYGEGKNVRDWLYVDDHCDAIWAVIERGRLGETYNVGGNQELRNVDLVRLLCRIVAEELDGKVEDLLGLITFVQDRPGHDLRYAIDASKIRSECGWQPRETLESGFRKTVRWYLEHRSWIDEVRSGEYRRWIEQNYATRSHH